MAKTLGHPLSFALGQWGIIVVAMLRCELRVASNRGEELRAFSQKHDLRHFVILAESMRTISHLGEGKSWEPSGEMPSPLKQAISMRGTNLRAWYIAEYLEACLASNTLDAGLETAEKALANRTDMGRQILGLEILRLHGELILAKDAARVP